MSLLQRIDAQIKPLVYEIKTYIKNSNIENLGTFYDVDWGGIPTQVVFDKICQAVHGRRPKSHWINYSYTERATNFAHENNFSDIAFLEYEPHEEVTKICEGAERVGIFGHHKSRDDIKKLCQEDSRFVYFNPRHVLRNIIEEEYQRGVPILYPFLKVAEDYRINTTLIAALGLRGYGYKKLYEEMLPKRNKERVLDKVIGDINLLVSHRLDNASSVVKALYEADSLEHKKIRNLSRLCAISKLALKKDKDIGRAINDSRIFEDVQIFPLQTDFQIIKAFVSDLDNLRAKEKLGTTLCIQYAGNWRKVSVRTSKNVDLPILLKRAHEKQEYKNFGGHEKSGGFISSHQDLVYILRDFLNSYFVETGQDARLELSDLSFLLQ